MDARQERSRDRLFEAVLDLAETTPVTRLTVSAVTARAGVHRTTFYAHASGPSDLLRRALRSELDALRAELFDDADRHSPAQVTREVAEHVLSHVGIYREGLTLESSGAGLAYLLTEHFAESSRQLFAAGRVHVRPALAELEPAARGEAVSYAIAGASVGLLRSWLRGPDPSVEEFSSVHAQLMLPWWDVD